MNSYGVRIDDGPLHEFDTLDEAEQFVRIVALGSCLRSARASRIEQLPPAVGWWLIAGTILLAWWIDAAGS